jgi:hypothetical protein
MFLGHIWRYKIHHPAFDFKDDNAAITKSRRCKRCNAKEILTQSGKWKPSFNIAK